MSGACLERIRLSAYLVLAAMLGSVVWILDAAWGWSAGGWMTLRFGFHDSIASAVVHGVSGFLGIIWVGIFAAGYPTGVNNVDSSIGGQLIGVATFVPLGFLSGWVSAWVLKKLNLLRVPPEVEIAGLDTVEYVPGIYLPEVGEVPAMLVEPDGTLVEADPLILEEANELLSGRR
jgi:ammonia channel protein AmtB